ncbi:glycine zipper 2TM domain-containing protein [Photobacterium sp. 1_MG-2023]|uniref:glycine zipper 2TM domain-containing protein n=1 Tax=Photobacterium sp. 1_MG-2023 TaxID=3062646 RepID=UPI0026E28064|nr:glycine zipper 2TM domain-containing protein [Photobacterium sp. 1_MG-2023]MDO6705764.1 glycine zipper 2TM domain-containing protein [Photobacterium sp. 1_MG-2023]
MKYLLLPLCIAALIISGCSSNPYGNTYGRSQAQQVQQVKYGTIIQIDPVSIEGEQNVVGTLAGAAIGGILGSKIGGGSGSDIAAIGGGVLGGYAGNKASQNLSESNGVNLTIRLDSGETIAIVQKADPNMLFSVGQKVRVNITGRTARVVPQ